MQKVTEVRLTLAAYIYAIEMDLRYIIQKHIVPLHQDLSFLRTPELKEKVSKRFQNDNYGVSINDNLDEAINFIDFQDAYTIILQNPDFVPPEIIKELKAITAKLNEIAPIRNRVMHSRPLLAGDFSTVYAFIVEVNTLSNIPWSQTISIKQRIEKDPYYVLSLTLPSYAYNDTDIINNLPVPDFDETGFIGRKKDVEDVKKLILSNNRVVSIIGNGGVGKTSLMLKVAYDILDMKEKCPFDLIIWTTAKTTMLTANGIQEINDALRSSYEVLGSISDIVNSDKTTVKERIDEILEYFDVFNVLLIIDNLETILDGTIRDFIKEAQLKCKIAITSRIGLGELEYRRLLTGLTDVESVQLVKQIASIRNNNVLLKLSNTALVEIAKKLYHSPLALKWFVNSVDTGLSPNEILNKKADLLNFCLTNVLSKLSDNARLIINTILASRKSLNDAELAYLTELKHLELRQAINELSTTTLLSKEIKTKENTQEVTFAVSSFAKDFLVKEYPISGDFVRKVTTKIKALNESVSNIKKADETNEFGLNALMIRNSNEKVVARLIREALYLSKRDDYKGAFIKLDEARDIAPSYFEIYRISGFLKAQSGDIIGADEDYKIGLEIEEDNPRLLYYYAQFLLFQFDDVETALDLAKKVIELRPLSPYPSFLYARCYARGKSFDKAVAILEELLTINNKISSREKIIAHTDLISFSIDWATEKIKVELDYQSAISIFMNAIQKFEISVQNKEYDQKMLKHICDLLISYASLVPKMHKEDQIDYLKEFLANHYNLLSFHHLKGTVFNKFKDNYGIDVIDNIDQYYYMDQMYKGTLSQVYENRHYAFIKTEDSISYFAHKDNFLNINSWSDVRENQFVRFDLGTNNSGVCAVNILIIEN